MRLIFLLPIVVRFSLRVLLFLDKNINQKLQTLKVSCVLSLSQSLTTIALPLTLFIINRRHTILFKVINNHPLPLTLFAFDRCHPQFSSSSFSFDSAVAACGLWRWNLAATKSDLKDIVVCDSSSWVGPRFVIGLCNMLILMLLY